MATFTFPAFGHQAIQVEAGSGLSTTQKSLVIGHLITTAAWVVRTSRVPPDKRIRYTEKLAVDLVQRACRDETTLRSELTWFVARARSFEPDSTAMRGPINEVADALVHRRFRVEPGEEFDFSPPWVAAPELQDAIWSAMWTLFTVCDRCHVSEAGAELIVECQHPVCADAQRGDWYRVCRRTGIDPTIVRLLHGHAEQAGWLPFQGRAARLEATDRTLAYEF